MRKGFLMVLAVALVAVLAAPAVAGTDINGFFRSKGYVSNFKTGISAPPILNDMPTGGYVEHRLRVRFSFGEENAKVVWFSEIDNFWGDQSGNSGAAPTGAQRNTGGALGGDRVNLETKNIYVWFKLPNTSLDFTVGLQNQTDTFQGLLYGGADMSGIFVTGKYEPVNWKLGFAKLYENSITSWDDVTLYTGQVNFAPSKDSKLGFSVYFLQDDSQKTANPAILGIPVGTPGEENTKMIWTVGLDGAYNAGPVALSGFFLYQFGEIDPVAAGASTIDVSAFAADLRADANLGPGKFFIEGLILSGGDNSGDKYQSVVTLSDLSPTPGGNSAFTRMDYSILLGNADDIGTNVCLIGCFGSAANSRAPAGSSAAEASRGQSPGNFGRGIWTVGLGYSMKVADKTTAKIGAGYLAAMKTLQTDTADYPSMDKEMGWEINGNVNHNIMKGLDFGLYAAWAQIGDFFQGTTATTNSPDSVYDLHFRLNYAF